MELLSTNDWTETLCAYSGNIKLERKTSSYLGVTEPEAAVFSNPKNFLTAASMAARSG